MIFPRDTYEAICATYGKPSDDQQVVIQFPYPMRLAWETHTVVHQTRCHRLVKDSLTAILKEIKDHYGSLTAIREARMDLFGGLFNIRKMRGGSAWSRHSWGIAIDLDPDQNGLHTPWPRKATMPLAVIEIFERHGWKSYARAIGRDAMHFQATL